MSLKKLEEDMRMTIEPVEDGFNISEQLEHYLNTDFTREDLLKLAKDLTEMANGSN